MNGEALPLDEGMEMIGGDAVALVVVALAAFCWRRWRGRTQSGDWMILFLLVVPSSLLLALSAVKCLLGDKFVTFWRYHYPAYVVAFAYAGWLLAQVRRRFPWTKMLLALGVVALCSYNFCRFARHYFRPETTRDAAQILADDWAADLIRRDWPDGCRRAAFELDLDHYVSTRLPVVYCICSPRTAYLAGGRMFEPFRAQEGREALPHYWLCTDIDETYLKSGQYYKDPPRDVVGTFSVLKRNRKGRVEGNRAWTLYRTAYWRLYSQATADRIRKEAETRWVFQGERWTACWVLRLAPWILKRGASRARF